MFGLFSCLNALRHPRRYYREKFKLPLIRFAHETAELYKRRTEEGVNNLKEVIFRGSIVALVTSLLVWLSVFMYIAFYYAYVPAVTHERPVHLQFSACGHTRGMCSFPEAHIQLTKKQQLLMLGQPYKVHLDLEMPESPVNKELGMFMVCAKFEGSYKRPMVKSCRSAIMRYRSNLIELLHKLTFSPLFVLGGMEEKQMLHIELFSDYEDKEDEAVTDVRIEIQSKFIEIYSAKFLINAEFSGLRYVMFYWPLLSATIGITSNLFFIALVCVISWYQIINSEEYQEYTKRREKEQTSKRLEERAIIEEVDEDDSSSIEDTSLLGEIQQSAEKKSALEELPKGK